MQALNDEPHATVSAHIPVSLRRQLVDHARESDRTFSGEVRRALAYYVERVYEHADQPDGLELATR
jgi:hypothetical protein